MHISYIVQSATFGGGTDPTFVSCVVGRPDGIVNEYIYGIDPEIARDSPGNYTCTVERTISGPYYFWWYPNIGVQYFPGTGIILVGAPPPVIPPLPTPRTPSAQPGLFVAGRAEPGIPNSSATASSPTVTINTPASITPSAQPGLFVPGFAEAGIPNGVANLTPIITPPPPVSAVTLVPSAQPGLFAPGKAEPGIPNSAATTLAPPPAPVSNVLPDTTSGFHQLLVFNYNAGSASESTIDYVWGSSGSGGVAPIHEKYYPWSQASTDRGTIYTYAWFETNHPDWILYRSDRLTYAQYTFDAANPATIDITQPAVQDWVVSNWLLPPLAAGFDGISVDDDPSDNVFNAAGHYGLPIAGGGPRSGSWVNLYTGATVDNAWASAQATALKAVIDKVRAHYPNATFTVNNGYFPQSTTHMTASPYWDDIIYNTGASMMADERAFSGSSSGGQLTDSKWTDKMAKLSAVAQTKGLDLVFQEGYTVTANMTATNTAAKADLQWAMANYFLCKGSATYFFWGGNSQYGFAAIPQAEFTTVQPIGSATNTYHADQGVYRRDFTNGLVFVNPSSLNNFLLNIPASTYRDLYGNIQPSSFTLNAHTGLVLLHV